MDEKEKNRGYRDRPHIKTPVSPVYPVLFFVFSISQKYLSFFRKIEDMS